MILILVRSSWSRAMPPIEIGDISKEESMNYLIEKRKIDDSTAKLLYKIVGGRILDLKAIADNVLRGRSIESRN